MKLELKHLAPYLPYELKMASNTEGRSAYITTIKRRLKKIEILTPELIEAMLFLNRKPILRPISDLTKKIEVNGERFVPIEHKSLTDEEIILLKNLILCPNLIAVMAYSLVLLLLKWHFDIFGLIENNLAIDINEL